MTTQERISIIDKAIVEVNAYLSHYNSDGSRAKNTAIDALKKANAGTFINAIHSVSFPYDNQLMGGLYNTMDVREESKRVAYRQCINAIVAILQQARVDLVEKLQEEQQKESERLQKESIKWGKIAAFGSIASIIVSIILYFCNN